MKKLLFILLFPLIAFSQSGITLVKNDSLIYSGIKIYSAEYQTLELDVPESYDWGVYSENQPLLQQVLKADCYLPKNNSDYKKNWEALCDCKKQGRPIVVDQEYKLDAKVPFYDNHDLIIKGSGKENSGLVFLNPILHFDSDKGINMSFENVSITTGNYDKFKSDSYLTKTKFSDFYRLQDISAAVKNVDIEYIKIKNCFVGGSLQILLGGNQKDYSQTNGNAAPGIADYHSTKRNDGVDALIIEDNEIEYPYVLASVSAFPKYTSVRRNNVYNLRQSMVKVGYADNVYVDDNHVKNDFIAMPGMTNPSGYISLLVALGANKLEGHRNSFVDVLSKGGCEVCHIFPSVRNLIWDSNTSINSFGIADGGEINLMKLKQCENYTLSNNNFEINRDGYYKIGLLASVDAPIETINPKYYMSLLSPSNDYVSGFTAKIIDNRFSIPNINRASLLMSDNNEISDNIINIEYVSDIEFPTVYNKSKLLFSIEGGDRGYLKFNRNALNIGKAKDNKFGVIGFKKAPHRKIENCGNSYYFTEPTMTTFGRMTSTDVNSEGRISYTYIATDNFINKGSIEDVSSITFENSPYPFTESNNVSYTIGNSIGKTAETHIANLESIGKTKVEVLQNNSDSFGVFRFLYSDFVSKSLNDYFKNQSITVNVKFTGMNATGIEETLFYQMVVKDRILIYSGLKFPAVDKRLFKNEVKNLESKPSAVKLIHRNFQPGDASYLVFENLAYKSFTVSVSVQKN